MLASGRYFVPTINGEPYFDKPLLSYWLIAAVARLTGSVSEWSIRLPSAIEALVALAATRSLGRRLWGSDVAEAASWLLLSSYGFLAWARMGEADMGNLAAIVVAVAWYWRRRDRLGFTACVVFYLIIAFGAHLKGLAALILPPLLVLPDLIRGGRWRVLLSVPHAAAAFVGASVFLAPYLAAAELGGGTAVPASLVSTMVRENVVRYLAPFDHIEPVYVYIYYLPVLLLPWAPLLVESVAQVFRSNNWRRLPWPTTWLAASCGVIFLFFTASGSRRGYYLLPLLPFAALWMALYATERLGPLSQLKWGMSIQRALILGLGAVEVAVGAVMPMIASRLHVPATLPLRLSFVCVGLTMLPFTRGVGAERLARLTGLPRALAPQIVGVVVLFVGYFGVQQPLLETTYGDARSFAGRVLAARPPGAVLAFYRHDDDPLVFYLHQPERIPVLHEPADLAATVEPSKPLMLLGRAHALDDLASRLPAGIRVAQRVARSGRVGVTYDSDRPAVALLLEEGSG